MKTEELQKLRIAVIGGGYAGATAGLALSQLGADVTVYEQAKEVKEVGAGIGLRPASVKLFRKLGIFDEIAAVTSPSDYFEITDAKGNVIKREEWPFLSEGGETNNTRMVHRGDFIDVLTGQLPEGVLQLDHKLTGLVDHGTTTTLSFADGKEVEVDLVVGADGIRSGVRAAFSTDAQPVPAHSHAYRAVISGDLAEGQMVDDNLHLHIDFETGAMIYFLPLRHRNQVSFDITVPSDDLTWNPQVTKEDLLHVVRNFDEKMVRIVEKLDMADVNARAVYDIDPVEKWNTDSIVLIGDAAHAMLHHQGQGANSALLDGGAIADALAEADTVAEAVAAFVAERKEPTQALQRISRESWDEDSASTTAFPERDSIDY